MGYKFSTYLLEMVRQVSYSFWSSSYNLKVPRFVKVTPVLFEMKMIVTAQCYMIIKLLQGWHTQNLLKPCAYFSVTRSKLKQNVDSKPFNLVIPIISEIVDLFYIQGKRKKHYGSDSSSSGGEISDLVQKLADKVSFCLLLPYCFWCCVQYYQKIK